MEETQLYLKRAACVKAYGRHIKEDDMQGILARKSNVVGTKKSRRLVDPNTFFVVCPYREVVHYLMSDDPRSA